MPPEWRRSGDAGAVTAELALALPALLFVVAGAVTVQTAVAARATCADAARAGARAAARGESDAVIRETVQRVSDRATAVQVSRRDGRVLVTVTAQAPSFVARIAAPAVTATAAAQDEDAG